MIQLIGIHLTVRLKKKCIFNIYTKSTQLLRIITIQLNRAKRQHWPAEIDSTFFFLQELVY